jgi:hypothetical protein
MTKRSGAVKVENVQGSNKAWLFAAFVAGGLVAAALFFSGWGAAGREALWTALGADAESGTSLTSSSSESLPDVHEHPSPAMAKWLLHGDEGEPLDETLQACLNDPEHRGVPLEKRFVSVPLPLIEQQPQMYFVRAALDPFCMYFYGAHTFTYWIVQEVPLASGPVFTIADMDAADFVNVLPSHHEGLYDLELGVCTAAQCTYWTRQRSGDKFTFSHCRREHFDEGKLVRTEKLDCDALQQL